MRKRSVLGSVLVAWLISLVASPALANAPAPWWACEGKSAGDACESSPYYCGECVVESGCDDDLETDVNECLQCAGDCDEGGCSSLSGPAAAMVWLQGALVLLAMAWRRRKTKT